MAIIAVLLMLAVAAALVSSPRLRARAVSSALTGVACVGLLSLGVAVLLTGIPASAGAGEVLGFTVVSLRFDALSAWFLIALGLVGVATSVFGIGYAAHGDNDVDRTTVAYPLFVGSLALVFGADDVFAFLLAWELMALSSAVLVVGPRPAMKVARAGYVYIAFTHLATAALVVALGVLSAAAGSTSLSALGPAAAGLSDPIRDALFVLLLVGFATKAGAIPFHVWLPRAHPVAPTPVSALMSGVMIKVGVYGLVRFVIEILGPGAEWWGLLVLAIGVASAVLGVLYALMEHDLKRLLAFHSIENIGIILIGLAVAMVAARAGSVELATIALVAALFHTLNHALFKSLLFLAAGSVQAATGSRDLNKLGGLARAMPLTGLAFGIGAAAISGLPPLNGFASEWLTFQALLGGAIDTALSPLARSAFLLAVGGLGLTAALAVACFVKATGVAFLGLPTSHAVAAARESGRSMIMAMAMLALLCIGVGVVAAPVAAQIAPIAAGVLGHLPPASFSNAVLVGPTGVFTVAPLALLLAAVAIVAWVASGGRRRARRSETWTCGIAPQPQFQYTATSFAKLIRLYYGRVLRPARELTVELHPGTPFPRTVRYRGEVSHVIDERLFGPLHRIAVLAARVASRLQSGSLQLYLTYAVAALVVLLLVAR